MRHDTFQHLQHALNIYYNFARNKKKFRFPEWEEKFRVHIEKTGLGTPDRNVLTLKKQQLKRFPILKEMIIWNLKGEMTIVPLISYISVFKLIFLP